MKFLGFAIGFFTNEWEAHEANADAKTQESQADARPTRPRPRTRHIVHLTSRLKFFSVANSLAIVTKPRSRLYHLVSVNLTSRLRILSLIVIYRLITL